MKNWQEKLKCNNKLINSEKRTRKKTKEKKIKNNKR